QDVQGSEHRFTRYGNPVRRVGVGLIDSSVLSVHEGVLVLNNPRLVILPVKARPRVRVDLHFEAHRARPLAGNGVVGGNVLADPVVPDLVGGPTWWEGAEVGQKRLTFAANMGLEHLMKTGYEAIAEIETWAWRSGGNLVGVVGDPMVVVVLAQFGPQRLKLVPTHAGAGRRNRLI